MLGRWRWVLLGVAAVIAVVSFTLTLHRAVAGKELAPVDLGALTLSLPEGTSPSGGYAYGKMVVPDTLNAAVLVYWRPGELQDDAQLDAGERAGAASQGVSDPSIEHLRRESGGLPSKTVVVRGPGYASDATQIICGGLRYSVRMTGHDADIGERHAAIVASAKCHPDPSRAADLVGPPVSFALPDGWKTVPPKSGAQAVYNGDGASLALQSLEIADADHFAAQMTAAAPRLGVELTYGEREEIEARAGEAGRWLWPTTLRAKSGALQVGLTELLQCSDAGPWVMAQLIELQSTADLAATTPRKWGTPRALLLGMTCKRI